ncbi:2-hydroxyacid dehydrogenase [Vallitalea guaymasensis]|uniref:2-hydroxyacid dehydrogenase n=1 Tax=Vallitalea guaymasensis TaxID=1185412 RepID=A0A8J8M7X2_9FIRM|nr:2-hydroxyacid dehydrogenase [Vallitalea guaymasensis]QUH27853.1 2-hydroxyacid dehydrogenase [Vallitalea guaymasensis]
MLKIAFFDTKPYDKEIFEVLNKDYGFEITYFEERLSDKTVKLTEGFDVVSIFVQDKAPSFVVNKLYEYGVKLIALRCAGYNNVNFKAAQGKVHVVHVPAYSPHAIAEFTMSMMLTLNRKIHKSHNRTKDLNFSLSGLLGFDMYQKTVGVIGTGKIAKILIKILKGFECNVIAYDIYPDNNSAKELGFSYVPLNTLFKESDIITLHCPLTKDTEYIISEKSINKMKDGVMIVNTGRGKLINSKDLIEGLKEHKIGSAALDVYEEEDKYFYEDFSVEGVNDDILSRLITFPNVLITSHQAYFTKEALNNIATTTFNSITQFDEGKPLKNEIAYICDENGCAIKKVN